MCCLVIMFQGSVQGLETSVIVGSGEIAEVAEVAGRIVFVHIVVGAVLGFLGAVVLGRSLEDFPVGEEGGCRVGENSIGFVVAVGVYE